MTIFTNFYKKFFHMKQFQFINRNQEMQFNVFENLQQRDDLLVALYT